MAGILRGSTRRYTPPAAQPQGRERDRKFDDWTNPFGIALDVISTPGDMVKSGVQEIVDLIQGEGFSGTDFVDQYSHGIGAGDILDDVWSPPENKMGALDPQRWGRSALGFAGEIILDPLSYIGAPGAGVLNRGGAKRVAAAASEPSAYIATALRVADPHEDLSSIAARAKAANDEYDSAIRAFNIDRLDTDAAARAASARRSRDDVLRGLVDELPASVRDRLDTSIQQLASTGGGAAAVTDEAAAEALDISTGLRLRPAFLPTRRGVSGGPQILSQQSWAKITAPVRSVRGSIAATAGWQRLADKFGKAQNAGLRELINSAENQSPEMMRALLAARAAELNIQSHVNQFSSRYGALAAGILADARTDDLAMDALWEAIQTPRSQWDDALRDKLRTAGVAESKIDELSDWYSQIDNEMRAVGSEHGWLGDVYIPWRMAKEQSKAGGRAAVKMPVELMRRIRPTYMGDEVPVVAKALAGANPIAELADDGTVRMLRPADFDQAGYLREIDAIGRAKLGDDFTPPELIKDQADLAGLYVWESSHVIANKMREDMLASVGLARTASSVDAADKAGRALSAVEQMRGKQTKALDDIKQATQEVADLSAQIDEFTAMGLPVERLEAEAADARGYAIERISELLNNRRLPAEHRQPLHAARRALRADDRRTAPLRIDGAMSDSRADKLADLGAQFDAAYRAAVEATPTRTAVDGPAVAAARAAADEFAAASDAMSSFTARVESALDALDISSDVADTSLLMSKATELLDDVTAQTNRWLTAADAFKEADPAAYTAIRQSAAAFERRLLNYSTSMRARFAAVSTRIAHGVDGEPAARRAAVAAETEALAGSRARLRELNARRREAQLERESLLNQARSLARNAADEQSDLIFENAGTIFGLAHRGRQMIPVGQLSVDAGTYQAKTAMNAEGVVRGSIGDPTVKAERWNPLGSSGVVWRRLDGSYWVIDGHQRTAFGKRLLAENPAARATDGSPIRLPAYVLEEADGWGQAEAYMAGTIKNVIEGSVSPYDYAAFLRAVPRSGALASRVDEIVSETAASIGSGSELLQNAARLNRLSDAAFDLARRLAANPRALSTTDRALPAVLARGISYANDPRKAGGPEWWISHVGSHIDEPAHHADIAADLWANLLDNADMRTLPAVSAWLTARNDLINGTVAGLRDEGVEVAGTTSLFDALGDDSLAAFRLSSDLLDVKQIVEQQVIASLKATGRSERMATAVQRYVVENSDATDDGYQAIVAAAERLREMQLPDLFEASNRMGLDMPAMRAIDQFALEVANTPAMADSRNAARSARTRQFADARRQIRARAPQIAADFRAHIENLLSGDQPIENVTAIIQSYAEDAAARARRLADAEAADARRLADGDHEPVATTANDRLAEQLKQDAGDTDLFGEPAAPQPRRLPDDYADPDEPDVPRPGAGQVDIFGGVLDPDADIGAAGPAVMEAQMFEPPPPPSAAVAHDPRAAALIDEAEQLMVSRREKQARTAAKKRQPPPGTDLSTSREVFDFAYAELDREYDRLRKELLNKIAPQLPDATLEQRAGDLLVEFGQARLAFEAAEREATAAASTPESQEILRQVWMQSAEGRAMENDLFALDRQWVNMTREAMNDAELGTPKAVIDEARRISQAQSDIIALRSRMRHVRGSVFRDVPDERLDEVAHEAEEFAREAADAAPDSRELGDLVAAFDTPAAVPEPPQARPSAGDGIDDVPDPDATRRTVDRAAAGTPADTRLLPGRTPDPAAADRRTALLDDYAALGDELYAARAAYGDAYEALRDLSPARMLPVNVPRAIGDDLLSFAKRTQNGKSWWEPRVRRGLLPVSVDGFVATLPEPLRGPARAVVEVGVRRARLWREAHASSMYLPTGQPKPQTTMTGDERLAAVQAQTPAPPRRDTLADIAPALDTSGSAQADTARARYAAQQHDAATLRLSDDADIAAGPVAADPPPDEIASLQQRIDAASSTLDDIDAELDSLLDAATAPPPVAAPVATQTDLAGRIRHAVAIGSAERADFERLLANFAPAATRYATLPAAAAANMDIAARRVADLEQALPRLDGADAVRARTEMRLMRHAETQAEAIMRAAPAEADPQLAERFAEAALIAYNSEIARAHTVRLSAARARLEELEEGEAALTAGMTAMADEAAKLAGLASDTRVRSAIMHETVAGAKQWRGVMTSADVAQVFDTADRAADLRGWERHVRQTMKWWRGVALMSPGFHVRNGLSGMWSNWAAGVTADDYAKVLPEYWALVNDGAVRNAAVREFIVDMMDSGIVGRGVYGTEIPDNAGVTRSLNPFAGIRDSRRQFAGVSLSRTAGNHVEHGLRLAVAYKTVREAGLGDAGIAARAAAAKAAVDQWHFDYTNLSHMEQRLRDYVVPFWTWQSRNIPLMMSVFASRPQAVLATERLFESVGAGQPTNPWTPEWYDKQSYRQISDEWFLAPDIPHISAMAETDRLGDSLSSPSGFAATAVGFNPWLRSAVELVTGRDAARGYELAGSEKWRRSLSGAIPPLSQAQRLLPETVPGATEGMQQRVLSSRLAYLGLPLRRLTDYDEHLAYLRLASQQQ